MIVMKRQRPAPWSAPQLPPQKKTLEAAQGGPAFLRPPLWAAAALLVLEVVIAALFHLSLIPFLVCTLILGGVIVWVSRAQTKLGAIQAASVGRVLSVALLLKVIAVCVGVTGGFASPIRDVLFIPVFLSALYYGPKGSLLCAGAIALFYGGLWTTGASTPESVLSATVQMGVLLLVAAVAGLFAEQLNAAAGTAYEQVREQERRAAEVEWFTETAVSMQTFDDSEHMMNVALLRLNVMIPCDAAVVYLRDNDESQMTLAQTLGIRDGDVRLRRIADGDLERIASSERDALLWNGVEQSDIGGFQWVDEQACSVLAVPLRTFDDFFGVIVVTARRMEAFGERERYLLTEYAKHISHPVQRVRLQAMATTDALTGLSNRRAFLQRLQGEVDRAHRYGTEMSLVLLDIDHFKRVNDTLGHQAGDAILSQVGGILRQTLRGTDFPARYGGEELAVICPDGPEAASALAERIRVRIESNIFHLPNGVTQNITISAGVASMPPQEVSDTAIIKQADAALYQAKAAGRNRVRVAAPAASGNVPVAA